MSDKAKLEALTKMFLEELGGRLPAKTQLEVVGSPAWDQRQSARLQEDDEVTRHARLKRIRWLGKAFRMQPIIDQHCFGLHGPEDLDSTALRALHQAVEKARECPEWDCSWEDAGLIQSNYQEAL